MNLTCKQSSFFSWFTSQEDASADDIAEVPRLGWILNFIHHHVQYTPRIPVLKTWQTSHCREICRPQLLCIFCLVACWRQFQKFFTHFIREIMFCKFYSDNQRRFMAKSSSMFPPHKQTTWGIGWGRWSWWQRVSCLSLYLNPCVTSFLKLPLRMQPVE